MSLTIQSKWLEWSKWKPLVLLTKNVYPLPRQAHSSKPELASTKFGRCLAISEQLMSTVHTNRKTDDGGSGNSAVLAYQKITLKG